MTPQFLYYFLRSYEGQRELVQASHGTVQVNIAPRSVVEQISIPVPPLNEQHAIAYVLSTLDDKIELNRHMNETLEATVRAIFKSWFVDFDPVRAKASGEPTDSICHRIGLTPDLLALFPNSFQDSELGEIPAGWQVKSIGDVMKRLSVGKRYEQKTVKPSGKIPVLDQGKSGVIGYHDDEPGVVASTEHPIAVFANHTCYMRLIYFPFSAIQNVLPFVGRGVDTIWVFYATYGIQPFIEYKGHWPDFLVHKVIVPSLKLTDAFSEQVHSFLKLSWAQETETCTLIALRDTLLPKLLSGELRIPIKGNA